MLFVKINKITTALFLIIALYTNSGLYAFTQNIYFKINAAPNDKSAYTFKLLKFENATFVLLDSAYAKSGSEIKFSANETSARLYKISIPNSGIKEVDFIVSPNEETLHISGTVEEFNTNSFLFSNSNENNCWQSVQNAQQYLKNAQDKNTELIQALDRFDSHKWRKFNLYDTILNSSIFSYNQALVNFSTIYPATYCGTNLIADLKFPSRFDTQEWRLQYDNDDAFLHDHFFDNFNFKDERILHFPYLFPSIFTYFKFYNYGTEEGYKNFIDLLFKKEASLKVQAAISDFLIQLFASQNQASLVQYLLSKSEVCTDDNPNSLSGDISKVMPGNLAHNVILKDINNKKQSLAELVKSKKITALIFYSPSCPHCIDFFKELFPIYSANKDKLGIYTISTADETAIKDFNKTNGYNWINTTYKPTKEYNPYTDYVVLSTPTIVLIDSNMKIVSRFTNLETIKELLNK